MLIENLPSRTYNRSVPCNLSEGDEDIFGHEHSYTTPQSLIYKGKNVLLSEGRTWSLLSQKEINSVLSERQKVGKKELIKNISIFFSAKQIVNNGIWMTDHWSLNYFHWFTDVICRYMSAKKYLSSSTIILPTEFSKFEYIISSLKMLQLEPLFIDNETNTKVKNIEFVGEIADSGNYNDDIIKQVRTAFSPKTTLTTEAQKRIYISRENAARRKILNEVQVIEILKKYGFEIHYFEHYTLKQQIDLMAQSSALVSLHGAGLTNILFMPIGGKVLELRNTGDAHNNCYYSLASSCEQAYYYLLNDGDSKNTFEVNITVNISQLVETLDQMGLNCD